jgi:hypothetical protein
MPGYKQKWHFGMIRKVSIDEDEAAWEIYDYLYTFPEVQRLFDNQPFRVIGEVDGMMPLARKKGEEKVFALSEMETYEIIPVASGLKQLVPFLNEVQKMWNGHPGETTLPVTEQNLAKARELLEFFQHENPGINPDFWEINCFPGLNLGFQL